MGPVHHVIYVVLYEAFSDNILLAFFCRVAVFPKDFTFRGKWLCAGCPIRGYDGSILCASAFGSIWARG